MKNILVLAVFMFVNISILKADHFSNDTDVRLVEPPFINLVITNFENLNSLEPVITLNGEIIPHDGSGTFTFDFNDLLEDDNVIEVVPNNNPLNNISTLDIVLLYRVLITELFGPVVDIASDVDRSGSVTTKDLNGLRKSIIGLSLDPLMGQPFIVERNEDLDNLDKFDFINSYNSFTFDRADVEGIESLEFELFQYGNLSEAVSEFHKSEVEVLDFDVKIQDQILSIGDIVEVPFVFAGDDVDIIGAGFRLQHPSLELVYINSGVYEHSISTNEQIESETTVLYLPEKPSDQLELSFTFKAKTSGRLSDLLLLDETYHNELIDEDFIDNKLRLTIEKLETNEDLFSIYPNPVVSDLYIEMSDPNSEYDVSITNLLGQQIYKGKLTKEHSRVSPILQEKGILVVLISNNETQIAERIFVP